MTRMFTNRLNTFNHTSTQSPRSLSGRMAMEDSSEELMKTSTKTMAVEVPSSPISIPITLGKISSIFGLSYNKADDYMQKDLISSSWN